MAFRFETMDIWHMARAYASQVYSVTVKFPRYEDYGLRSQMNRAVNSISLNIAEGEHKVLYNEGERLAKSINALRNTLI
jgi:four helix bundle protein